MRITARALLRLLVAVALVRAALYVAYVVTFISTPFEITALEPAWVHCAWRVQHGVQLYPDWEHYPHVANFFGPVSFLITGALGKALSADIDGLFSIGRRVTVASVLLTSLVLGVVLGRRYGKFAALLGTALSLAAGPLFPFGLMTRPDAPAEFFGLTGFFLATGRRKMTRALGGLSLCLAALTKQPALLYFVSAVLGLYCAGRGRDARFMLAGVASAMLVTVLGVQLSIAPHFVRSLLGEAGTATGFAWWWQTISLVGRGDPQLFILPLAGVVIWTRGPSREPAWSVLAGLLLAATVIMVAKRGADVNYFLGIRSVAGLAAGALAAEFSGPAARPKVWQIITIAVVLVCMIWNTRSALAFCQTAALDARFRSGEVGRALEAFHRRLRHESRDARKRFLTDSGMIDIQQGERTVFGDSYLFKLMVEDGRINPSVVATRIDSEYYDFIFCAQDLFSPAYPTFDFGLPRPLADRARRHYEPSAVNFGLFIYTRRAPR
jgi:hypothetical protein